MQISLIVPTLNESLELSRTIQHARSAAEDEGIEIIVADCESSDNTSAVALSLGVDVFVRGATCRSDAINRAARRSHGEVLTFLHADSLLPLAFDRIIRRALRRADVVGGAFDFAFRTDTMCSALQRHLLKWVVLCNRTRFRWTGNFYGDQAIFVRREVFDRMGGFPPVSLMEDIHFSRLMRRRGRTVILRPPVQTSPRRFLARGVARQFCEDMVLLGCDSFSLYPQELIRQYNHLNRQAHRCGTDSTLHERIHGLPA